MEIPLKTQQMKIYNICRDRIDPQFAAGISILICDIIHEAGEIMLSNSEEGLGGEYFDKFDWDAICRADKKKLKKIKVVPE